MQPKNLSKNSPKWVAEAIVYQIFPDRFRKSGRVHSSEHLQLQPWGTDPCNQGFHGGDLYGVIESLDHIQSLGINCLYLTPVFTSAANHRYHTYDYLNVDPILGGNAALKELIKALHARDMRIVLDGVFNHCGRGFWAFHNLLENGETSPYKDWFHVHNWPLNPYPKRGEDCGYSCWWNNPALPKFNHQNQYVRDYLIQVALHWIRFGIDGWRLDVPDEIPFDFWVEFRKEVKFLNSNTWIVGEIWGDARQWLNGEYFDGVMNYRMGWSILSWVSGGNLRRSYKNPSYPIENIDNYTFIEVMKTTLGWYSDEVNRCQLNLLDSHDVPRALNTLRGDLLAMKLALLLLFLQPGAPSIFYGTEAGLSGGIEPDCREDFPWESNWDVDLSKLIRSLTVFRKDFPEIRSTRLEWESLGKDGLVGWEKEGKDLVIQNKHLRAVFINRSRRSWLDISQSLSEELFVIGKVDLIKKGLGPQSAVLLKGVCRNQLQKENS